MAIENSRARPPMVRVWRRSDQFFATRAHSTCRLAAKPSQRNPDAEEPKAPVVEVGIEDRLHPAAVVVERLVVVPALIQSTPREVRRRGPQFGPPGAARSTTPFAGSTLASRSATPVAGSTWASRSATPVAGSTWASRSAGASCLPGTPWGPPGPPGPWQVPRWGPHGDRPGCAAPRPTPAVSAETPTPMAMAEAQVTRLRCMATFEAFGRPLINPTAARYAGGLCPSFSLGMSGHRAG
jgi:hypothetical protein